MSSYGSPDRIAPRSLGGARAGYFPPQRTLDLTAWGLALIFVSYVIYVPAGPALIRNELVVGRNGLSDTLEKAWSAGRYLMALGVAPLLLRTRSGAGALARCWPVLPFALFAAASIAWSAFPKESLRQILNLFGVMVITSTLVSWYGLAGFGRRVQIVTGIFMIASVLTALLLPRLGVHHGYDLVEPSHAGKWRGIFLHKNLLGGIAVTSLIYALRSTRNETRLWQAFFAVARGCTLACLIMAGSAGAWGGSVIAVMFFMLMKNRITANPFVIVLMILLGVALVSGLSLSADRVSAALGRDATFSGRTEIWALGRSMIQDHLLFGSGLASDSATFGDLAKRYLFSSAVDLHSGYLDVVFNLGIVGAALLVVAVGTALLRGLAYIQTHVGEERDQAAIYMTLVVAAWAIATVETSPIAMMGDGAIGLWTALAALYQLGSARRRRTSQTLAAWRRQKPGRAGNRI
jgi:O-antigen ligase